MSDRPEFVSPWWRERIAALEVAFAYGIPDDFLSVPAVQDCGLVTEDRMAAAEQVVALGESRPDLPRVMNLDGIESPTDITHLYHLTRAGWPKEPTGSLVEWGGGFGNMARITRSFHHRPVHIVVDIPVMQRLQYAYLNRVSGRIRSEPDWFLNTIRAPRVYPKVPLVDMEGVFLTTTGAVADVIADQGPVDTFLATFSLDECTTAAHDYLIDEVDWFGARTVLVAMQVTGKADMFPDAAQLYERLKQLGFVESPTFFEGSVYLRLDR